METNTTRRHTATAMRTAREEGDDDADVFIVDVSSWVPIRRENDDADKEDAYHREDVVNRTASCPHSNRETKDATTSRRDRRARAMAEHRSGGFAHPLGGYFTARRGSSARTEEEASKPRRWRRGKRAAQPPQSASAFESGAFNWTTTTTTTRNDDGGSKMISTRSFSFGDENDNPMAAAFAAAPTVGCTKHVPADPTVGARMLVHAAQRRIDALRAARGATVPSSSYSFDVPRLGGSRCTKYDAYR